MVDPFFDEFDDGDEPEAEEDEEEPDGNVSGSFLFRSLITIVLSLKVLEIQQLVPGATGKFRCVRRDRQEETPGTTG
jgi:hypothetical protein